MTPKGRIGIGVVLVIVAFVAALAYFLAVFGIRNPWGLATVWALTIGGLVVLLYRRSEAPIAVGIILVLVALFLWFLSVLTPVAVFIVLSWVPAFALATYGFAIIALERADKRRKKVS